MARLFNVESIHREHVDPSASYDGKLLQSIQAILIVAWLSESQRVESPIH